MIAISLFGAKGGIMLRPLALGIGLALFGANSALAENGTQLAMREVTGTLEYAARIALTPGSEIDIEARGAFDTVLGRARIVTDGEQVPIPFSLEVPANLSGEISAAIGLNGKPRWLSKTVAIDAASGSVDLGTLVLKPVTPLDFATRFDCGTTSFEFGSLDDENILKINERQYRLKPVESASGARYVAIRNPDTELWNKGDTAIVILEGQKLPECRKVIPPAEKPYRAGGNEPGWSATIGDTDIRILTDYGETRRTAPRPDIEILQGSYVFDMPRIEARLVLRDQVCRDSATGMPHPHEAALALGDEELAGCGGDPADLLTGHTWRLSEISGDTIGTQTEPTIEFHPDGRVSGRTGCNLFMGNFDLTGEALTFSGIGASMMACPDPLMTQENQILDAMEAVTRFDITSSGALELFGSGKEPLLTAEKQAR